MRTGLLVLGLAAFLGGVAASQLLTGCACNGADEQGNSITPIPIPCGGQGASPPDRDAGPRSDGAVNRPDAGADAAPGTDGAAADSAPPPADSAGDDLGVGDGGPDTAPPDAMTADLPPAPDGGPDLDAGDGGADLPDADADAGDAGDGGSDAGSDTTGDMTPDA
jgi:hypothetical protein